MLGELVVYQPLLAPGLMLVCGLLLAFAGRRLVILALVLSALASGFLYGGGIMASFTEDPGLLKWGPVAISILLAVIVLILYRFAFFAAGFFLGFFLAEIFLPGTSVLAAVGISLGTGALVYFFRNFVFSVLTALLGASLTATGSVNLLAWTGVFAGVYIYWLIAIAVGFTGLVYQLKKGRKSK